MENALRHSDALTSLEESELPNLCSKDGEDQAASDTGSSAPKISKNIQVPFC
jgi:hypothetical protein